MTVLLKILCGLLAVWVAMTVMVVVSMPEREIAFLGMILTGPVATAVVLFIDILCPLVFIYAVLKKISWGAVFGLAYNGVFFLNSVLSLVLFLDKFGNAIYFPLVASAIFIAIIFKERKYFAQ